MLLGAAWAALRRLRELDLAYAAELRQEGGPAGGPLTAILPALRSLSLQARSAVSAAPPLTQQPLHGSSLHNRMVHLNQDAWAGGLMS